MTVPSDAEAEQAVLGACLISSTALEWAADHLIPGDFHTPSAGHAFAAMVALYRQGSAVDTLTVAAQMSQDGTALPTTGSSLIAAVGNAPLASHIERYAEIVVTHAVSRRIMALLSDSVEQLGKPQSSPGEVVDSLRRELGEIDSPVTGRDPGDISFRELRDRPEAERAPWIIPALLRLDWRVLVVAAEGIGKSILLRQLAVCASYGIHPFIPAKHYDPARVLLVDLENPEDELHYWIDRMARSCENLRPGVEDGGRLWHRQGGIDLRKRADRAELEQVLRRRRPEIVILGPLYKAHTINSREKDEQVASEVQHVLDDLRGRYEFALVIETHAPKGTRGVRDILPFGSSLWLRWSELGLKLTQAPDNKHLEVGRFRFDRVKSDWPHKLDRSPSSLFPWAGTYPEGLL